MNFLPSLSYHKRKGKENSSWWIWEGKNGKAKNRSAPPQTALREGAGLHSPSHMFLGLALRSPVLFYSEQKSLRFSRTACPSPLKLFNSPSDCFCNLIKERIAQKHLFFSCICHKKTLYERTWHLESKMPRSVTSAVCMSSFWSASASFLSYGVFGV